MLKKHRQSFMLASKCGMSGVPDAQGVKRKHIDGRPDTLARQVEDSLRRLQTDVIDLYYLHRFDKQVPIEESVGALGEMVRKGHIRAVGLSEVSAATLRRAHKEYPVTAVQTEYSLWTRNPEIAVLEATREIGAAFVAFSPLARAYLTGKLTDVSAFDARDIRRAMPRFEPATYARNLKLLEPYALLAQEAECTPAQLALAWLLHKDENIIPIPGTASVAHLEEDMGAATVTLSADLIGRVRTSSTRAPSPARATTRQAKPKSTPRHLRPEAPRRPCAAGRHPSPNSRG